MTFLYTSNFLQQLKKANVRIRKAFKQRVKIFTKRMNDPILNNHPLKNEYQGYNSIDITNDYRAIFKTAVQEGDKVVYFTLFGTHEELYGTDRIRHN